MNRLYKLKTELALLKRATGVDAKGSADTFADGMIGPLDESVDAEAFYGGPGMVDCIEDARFCFGKDVNNWPKAVRERFV